MRTDAMTIPHLPNSPALLSLAFVLCACLGGCAEPVDTAEHVDVTSTELRGARFRNVRRRSGACKFEADATGPADAFVIANGQDISIVFTRLGAETRLGPAGRRVVSACNFEVPVGVPTGHYVAGWHQTLNYGAVKPAGVAAGLGLDSSLDATPGGSLPLPPINVRFARDADTNIAFDVAPSDLALDSSRPRHNQWRRSACRQGRDRDITFVGSAFTWSERTAEATPPVIIAIDGLDARVDLGADVQPCPETV